MCCRIALVKHLIWQNVENMLSQEMFFSFPFYEGEEKKQVGLVHSVVLEHEGLRIFIFRWL